MRLINTETLAMSEFYGDQIPDYVILSHRWSDEEISYQDFIKPESERPASLGYRKVKDFCRMARDQQFQWAWVDTCAIDKRSSAELSEAINSMYRWYANAAECWAFLPDVHIRDLEGSVGSQADDLEQFCDSVWFSRGWTLQELIAPEFVRFFGRDWQVLGHKSPNSGHVEYWGRSLVDLIFRRTNIDVNILTSRTSPQQVSIAKRFHWASLRITTREEDMAYCMLGLLGVNIPLLYGEGNRAWYRLQEEIIRTSHDESVFAWVYQDPIRSSEFTQPIIPGYTSPILAKSPSQFQGNGDVHHILHAGRPPYAITNQGLELRLRSGAIAARQFKLKGTRSIILFPLACVRGTTTNLATRSCYTCTIGLVQRWCGHFERFPVHYRPCISQLRIALDGLMEETPVEDVVYVHTTAESALVCGPPTTQYEFEPVEVFFKTIRSGQDERKQCSCNGLAHPNTSRFEGPYRTEEYAARKSLKRTHSHAKKLMDSQINSP